MKSGTLYGRVDEINQKKITISGITAEIYSEKILMGPCLSTEYIEINLADLSKLISTQDLVTVQITNKAAYVNLMAPCLVDYPRISLRQSQLHRGWCDFLNYVRSFFENKSFTEVNTPTLVDCPGTEPSVDVFSTILNEGQVSSKKYLPTSPELHLKKTLCRGLDNVFEIKKCFRNNEKSELHKNEFTMLEWYRSWSDLYTMKIDLQDFIFSVVQYFKSQCEGSFVVKTMSDLFYENLSFNLTPKTTKLELEQLAQDLNLKYNFQNYQSFDDLFHLIFVEKIEPKLKNYQTLFIEKYPPSQCAYAKLDAEGWSQRFEFYWDGIELANAFYEVNDPEEQKKRMSDDLANRKLRLDQSLSLDEDFFLAMNSGMPPCAGIALGLDRLFMKVMNLDSIHEFEIFNK
jgi:lysyl-tRNA synthetase class 2